MMIERHLNWPSLLNEYLTEVQKKIPDGKLDYKTLDCSRFIADGIIEMTGKDIFRYRNNYKSEIGAARLLKRLGGLRAALGSILGDEMHPSRAIHGDIVYWEGACGFCMGRNCLFLSDGGFSWIPALKVDCAFRF